VPVPVDERHFEGALLDGQYLIPLQVKALLTVDSDLRHLLPRILAQLHFDLGVGGRQDDRSATQRVRVDGS
jgi:hypothetical protein